MMCTIKKMKQSHLDEVCALEKICFSKAWTYDMFVSELVSPVSYYVVCIAEDKIVGYGGIVCVAEQADITNIAVHPDYREKKLGSKILSALLNYVKELGANKVFLEVRESNVPAQKLYRKYGFEEVSVRKRYYTDNGEDAVIMALLL